MRLSRFRFTKRYRLKDYNCILVALVTALSILGIFVVGSAKEIYQTKQIFGVVAGLIIMVVVSLIDYVWVLDFYWLIYGFAVLILGLVLVIGTEVNGATRWINLGFTTFQPSELAKILLILFFARFLMKHEDDLNDKRLCLNMLLCAEYRWCSLSQNRICPQQSVQRLFCVS